jgi:hypothetical protein
VRVGRLRFEATGANSLSISKITRAIYTGGVAQGIEHLLCKCEALSSNPFHQKINTNQK